MKQTIITAMIIAVLGAIPAFSQRTITLEELRNESKKTKPAGDKKTEQPGDMKEEPKAKTESRSVPATIVDDGSFSKVDVPFIFVARDQKTYKMLATMIDGFRVRQDIDFKQFAVVAAFSGEKETGGYSVSIEMNAGNCVVEDVKPVHGAIVTEALTKPYIVSLVPVEEQDSLNIVSGDTWKNRMENYTVTDGEFRYSGGFAGMSTEFKVKGTLSVLKFGSNLSLFFDVWEDAAEPGKSLRESASGTVNAKSPLITRLEAGDLIAKPHSPFKVDASFDQDKLTLKFTEGERDYIVSDGFEGSGEITAIRIIKP